MSQCLSLASHHQQYSKILDAKITYRNLVLLLSKAPMEENSTTNKQLIYLIIYQNVKQTLVMWNLHKWKFQQK